MSRTGVVFDGVWKKFATGERHDSLRDLIPAAAKRLLGRRPPAADLAVREFWAVKDVSFEVHAGEALGIIGRNGAGKSTILKLLTRILKPTRGTCSVAGRAGALIEVAAGFHPDLTGRENVYLQGAIMGMKRHEIAARFDQIVEFAGLDRFIDTQVKRYSSGMNARLGFSIAAHLNPDVLLIDEVLSVGDLAFQEKCQARMKEFRRQGVAIVFVSHHLPAVAQLCSQALLVDQGAPVRLGPVEEVVAEYCTGTGTSDHLDVAIGATLSTASTASAVPGAGVCEVVPGERLRLDVTLEFRVDVKRAVVGVVVWDPARDLYVYGVSSEFIGLPPVQAASGEVRTLEFFFDAHLTRGLYSIEVNVIDPDRHRFLAAARGLRHFRVVEDTSYNGVANLYLSGRDVSVVEPLPEMSAAAGRRA
jgi:homopolymeric O-antigen transport system ATP-binding protein